MSEVDRLRRRCENLELALRRARRRGDESQVADPTDMRVQILGLQQTIKEQYITSKYSDAESMAREVQQARARLEVAYQQREAAIEELRKFKETATRDAATLRHTWESKLAALTDKAFTLADPEVHT